MIPFQKRILTEEKDARNAIKQQFSSQALPDLSTPSLGATIDRYHADLEKRGANTELGLKRIFNKTDEMSREWMWEVLKDNKRELMNLFVVSDNTVNENKASISRFYEIVKEHRRFKVKLKHDIIDTVVDLEEYKKVKETMEKYVREYSIFEQFAEDVVAVSSDGLFLSVGDILNRYETLETTRMDIARILEAEMQAEAELRKEMLELMEKKSSKLKRLSNSLVLMQVSLKQAQDHRAYWETGVQRIKNKITSKEEEKVALQCACYDLYKHICQRRKKPPTLLVKDINDQLDYIQKSITFYKEVLTIATGSKSGGRRMCMPKSLGK